MSSKPWREISTRHEKSPERIARIEAETAAMLNVSKIAKIRAGLDELDRGEGEEWTPALMERLNQGADEMSRRGELADPDVCP